MGELVIEQATGRVDVNSVSAIELEETDLLLVGVADDFDFGLCHCATSVVGKLGGT